MSDPSEFPGKPPPYYADPRKDPAFNPASVPFSYSDPATGAVTTWKGMWDPDLDPSDYPYKVVPDPATAVGPYYPMSGSSVGSSGSPGTYTWTPTTKDPDMTDLSDADKIRAIADWFDRRDDDDTSEVQDDLRAIAKRLEDSVEPSIRVEQAIETMLDFLNGDTFEELPEDVTEAVEVTSGWLTER